MDIVRALLEPNRGTLILTVPVSTDLVVWNLHRVYGGSSLMCFPVATRTLSYTLLTGLSGCACVRRPSEASSAPGRLA